MKLSGIKKRIANLKPFLTYHLNGVNNALTVKDGDKIIPLSIIVSPPSMSFIAESGLMTSLILRYSKTYKSLSKGTVKPDKAKAKELANKVLAEVEESLLNSEEEQAKQLGLLTKLGKSFIIAKAVRGYYGDPNDAFELTFSTDKEEVDKMNDQCGDEHLYVLVELLDDFELIKIGSELISVLPTDQIANIPFSTETAQSDGTVKKEVSESAKADKLASFPRNTRSLAVEDVPVPSREET